MTHYRVSVRAREWSRPYLWVLLKYPDLDWVWLLREAKVDDLQNPLGFLVSVARQLLTPAIT